MSCTRQRRSHNHPGLFENDPVRDPRFVAAQRVGHSHKQGGAEAVQRTGPKGTPAAMMIWQAQ